MDFTILYDILGSVEGYIADIVGMFKVVVYDMICMYI